MNVLTFIVLSFYVQHCYGQNKQHKRQLDKLQLDIHFLRDLAMDLKLDIDDLHSWRNATGACPCETGVVESNNECVDSRLLGRFQQSLVVMEGRVTYIIKGLMGEKMALREMMEDMDTHITREIEKCETMSTEEKKEMANAFDAKLNQHMLEIETKDAEISEQLNRMSKQLETSRQECGEALGQLKNISNLLDEINTTDKDTTDIMQHRDEQYYITMRRDGWLQYKDFLYKRSNDWENFETAVKKCADHEASLVEISDEDEMQFLVENFEVPTYSWIGATGRKTEGEFRWLSDQLVKDGNWWDNGLPVYFMPGESCLVMDRYRSKYYAASCSRSFPYVCKRQ